MEIKHENKKKHCVRPICRSWYNDYRNIRNHIRKERELDFYEHVIETVDKLTFDEKIYLIKYLSSSIVSEMDDVIKGMIK